MGMALTYYCSEFRLYFVLKDVRKPRYYGFWGAF
jgi:hypothetical protein